MAGETDLKALIEGMNPVLNTGEFVFTTVDDLRSIPQTAVVGQFREPEGITLIMERQHADALHLGYDFVAGWITLTVYSSLEAVGLTAIFSSELARHGISCNVIAGFYHDHLFVPIHDAQKAMDVLMAMKQHV